MNHFDKIRLDNGQSETNRHSVSILTWFTACAFTITALSIAAAHAPARIRLIGLFSIAFGLVVGWGVVRIASQLQAQPGRRFTVFTAALLSLCGLIGSTLQTSRLDESHSMQSGNDALAARLIKEFEWHDNQSGSNKPSRTNVTAFQAYLSRRLQNLGNWSSPWPECFWLTELIATAIAAGWMSHQCISAGPVTVAERSRT